MEPTQAAQDANQPFDSTDLRNGLRENVPPPMREAYDRVVTAGMKIMFDQSTHHLLQEQLRGDGPIDGRLAEGVSGLMSMMLSNSNGAFPQQLIIPAGIELMLHAADFAAQAAGEKIDAETMGSAVQKFVFTLFEGSGVDPDTLMAGVGKMQELHSQGGGEQPPAQPPASGGGLLSQPIGA